MASCKVCGEDVTSLAFQCTGCQGLYCSDHRGAADHGCAAYDDRTDYDVVTPGTEERTESDGSPTPSTGGPAVAADLSDEGDTSETAESNQSGTVTPRCPDCGTTVTSMSDLEFAEMGATMGVVRASKRFYAASCGTCGRTFGTGVAGASGS